MVVCILNIFVSGIIKKLDEKKYQRLNPNSEAKDVDEFSAVNDLDSVLILLKFRTYMKFSQYCEVCAFLDFLFVRKLFFRPAIALNSVAITAKPKVVLYLWMCKPPLFSFDAGLGVVLCIFCTCRIYRCCFSRYIRKSQILATKFYVRGQLSYLTFLLIP